jgi:alanine dehydrogenase
MIAEHNNIFRMSQAGKLMPKEEVLEVSKNKSNLKIGVPREVSTHEHRIALVPQAVAVLVANGHEVIIESGAGESAFFSDEKYGKAGAHIVYSAEEVYQADLIVKIAPPGPEELELLKNKQSLISAINLTGQNEDYFRKLISRKMTAIAYEHIMDKTDSYPLRRLMSEIVGSTSVLIAAEYLSKSGYGKGCLLGGVTGITPSEVVILGAGTVGEYATRAALGLGASVKVFDNSVYRLRRLQNSLNTRIYTSIIQPKVLLEALKIADVAIGAIYSDEGRTPVVVTEEMVRQMKQGAVIIDVSIDQGGCFETSEVTNHSNPVFKKYDVTHYCVPNIASRVPRTASYAISNYIAPILLRMGEEGGLENLFRLDKGLRQGVYLFHGTITKKIISDTFALPYRDIELLMAAFH